MEKMKKEGQSMEKKKVVTETKCPYCDKLTPVYEEDKIEEKSFKVVFSVICKHCNKRFSYTKLK